MGSILPTATQKVNGDKVCTTNQICELFAKRFASVNVKDDIPFLHQIYRPEAGNEFVITNEPSFQCY